MRPAIIPDFTRKLAAPRDWDQEKLGQCVPLHIRDELDSGFRFMRSAWEPEGEEIGWLAAGGHLHVKVSGVEAHPAVSMIAQLPPEDSPPIVIARLVTKPNFPHQIVRVEIFVGAQSEPPLPARHGWIEISLEGLTLAEAIAQGVAKVTAEVEKVQPFTGDAKTG